MTYLLNIYKANIKIRTTLWMQYRAAMLIWLFGLIITPVVYLVIWTTVADLNGGSVGNITTGQMAAYYIAIMVINQLTYTWIMWEYDYRIRQGELSPKLLRPFHPIHEDIAENITFKLLALIVMLPVAFLLAWAFKPAFNFGKEQLFAFVPALVMAFLIQFLSGWTIAIFAFWTNRVSAINRVYFVGKFFLAGQMSPLILLPPTLKAVAFYSPFRYMLSFPTELLLGWVESGDVWRGLLAQLFWVVVLLVASQLIWRAGIKRYSAFGA